MKTAATTTSDVTYEKFIFESSESDSQINSELDMYLNTIDFRADMHLSAVWQLKYLGECLDTFNPDSIFFSFDGARGYDEPDEIMTREIYGMTMSEYSKAKYPDPIFKNYDKALEKLAECMETGELYIMIADDRNKFSYLTQDYDTLSTANQIMRNMTYLAMSVVDPVTMSTAEGREKIKNIIEDSGEVECEYDGKYYRGINIRDYAAIELDKYSVEIYSYSKPMSSTVKLKEGEKYKMVDKVDPRFNVGTPVLTLPMKNADGSLMTMDLDKVDVTASDLYTKLSMYFTDVYNVPIRITIPLSLKDYVTAFCDSNVDFDNTNVGDATVSALDEYDDGSEHEETASIKTSSPKLYVNVNLPTTGGGGTMPYICAGAAMMMLAAMMLRRKKRVGHEK
jgi:LPXTG-motif cell wall-anchored protein